MNHQGRIKRDKDPFLLRCLPSELKIASDFLTAWLPFLTRDLCSDCFQILADRIRSLDTEPADICENRSSFSTPNNFRKVYNTDENTIGSWKDGAEAYTHPLGCWKGERNTVYEPVPDNLRRALTFELPSTETPSPRMAWADMAQEDELEEEEEQSEPNRRVFDVSPSTVVSGVSTVFERPKLSREQREYIRLMNVKRKKDFLYTERFKGRMVNILAGLELHAGVFSAAEQKRIVDFIYQAQEKGQKGELKARTYSAPNKWMRGKGRVTIQFGCCYNYAMDKNGNPPGILQHEMADPIPHLFKVIIRRLIRWHVLPPTCVPDSCIVNIYEEGDCIPPHIDNHDFLRPFCTVSFLSECNILFGSNLKVEGPGDFSGSYSIPLPVGSVLVFNGNGADVAKHCVPAVPSKRISITFRKMDESKRPIGFTPEPDLQGIQPLPYEEGETKSIIPSKFRSSGRTGGKAEPRRYTERSNARGSRQRITGAPYTRRNRVTVDWSY